LSLRSNIGIIIQCRDNSTRMYQKSTRPFYQDKSILELLLYKLELFPEQVVVATTKDSLQTLTLSKMCGVDTFIGSENNVAARLLDAAKVFGFDGFFRICADNPFIQVPLMLDYLPYIERKHPQFDYIAYKNCMLRHEGFWTEFIRTSAIQDAVLHMKHPYDKEHVTPFIIRNKQYKKCFLEIPKEMNKIQTRFTVDTETDFKIAQLIFSDMGDAYWTYLIQYVKNNPEFQTIMFENIRRNRK